ncbi:BMP family ABC transporter substrate-binding protein [Herbiconiux sp. 11R-BC]|uniref:BMP family ABC transporter substrate-binding protein n=1 Tax=Herbiconiux sp. 11R-BC TaxID=3111637 RepID=UPI003BFF6616
MSTPLRPRRPRASGPLLGVLAVASLAAALLTGCGATAATPTPTPTDAAALLTPLGAGFIGSASPSPSPEATVTPEPGSWAGVTPPVGYRVTLISAGTDAATTTVVQAVADWAAGAHVALTTLSASNDEEVGTLFDEAVAAGSDLIVGAGNGVIDTFMLVTAQYLDQQVLVVGAELPEPTANVTSVVWPGAVFRGTGLGTSGDLDPASVTPERTADAIEAGVASVLHGHTGIVVYLS